MLDPFTAFAAVKSGISLIEQGIKSGKQLHDMASAVSKWANAESSLDIHASNKGKGGVLSKLGLSSIEEDALAAHLRKRELNQKRKELRELFLLYCDNGLAEWESLQAEIARLRAKKKNSYAYRSKKENKFDKLLGLRC
jgi:uncharacterized protein with von Willebrand factor type A (vWA) domain